MRVRKLFKRIWRNLSLRKIKNLRAKLRNERSGQLFFRGSLSICAPTTGLYIVWYTKYGKYWMDKIFIYHSRISKHVESSVCRKLLLRHRFYVIIYINSVLFFTVKKYFRAFMFNIDRRTLFVNEFRAIRCSVQDSLFRREEEKAWQK